MARRTNIYARPTRYDVRRSPTGMKMDRLTAHQLVEGKI